MDWFNENVHRPRRPRARAPACGRAATRASSTACIVNGSWKLVGRIAGVVRWLQSGYIYHYAFAMMLGVFVLMSYFVWFKR